MPLFAWLVTGAFSAAVVAAPVLRPAPPPSSPPVSPPLEIELHRIAARPNLISDRGFKALGPDGFPTGWRWSRRNTDANCEVASIAHSGKRSLFLTNGTRVAPNVYGVLFRPEPILLSEGHTYTLSAWVRTRDPGTAWFGTWADPQLRLRIPPTNGRWRRVSVTFVASRALARFYLIFVTENPTPGLWLDAVKLEEGDGATPDSDLPRSTLDALETPRTWSGDDSLCLDYELVLPGALPHASALLTAEPMHAALRRPLALSAGAWRLSVRFRPRHWSGDQSLRLRLAQGAGAGAETAEPMRFRSLEGLRQRLGKIQSRLPAFRRQLSEFRRHGDDISYPRVSLAVCERFVPFVADDLARRNVERATDELGDLEQVSSGLARLPGVGRGRSGVFPRVPRADLRVRPRLSHSSFLFPAIGEHAGRPAWRPVFQIGYGHFGQVRADLERLPALGVNLVQVEIGPKDVFPSAGTVNRQAVLETRHFLQRAARAGVGVDLLVSPHYLPDWMLEQHPELRKRRDGFLGYCLHERSGQDFLRRYLRTLLGPLRRQPALRSICLSNEPINVEEPCDAAAADWHRWLRKRHASLPALNGCWQSSFGDWDAIPLPDPFDTSLPAHPGGRWADWVRFNQDWFAGWHAMLRAEVHSVLPGVPVHAKTMSSTFFRATDARFGVEPTRFAGATDLNGRDGANLFEYGQGEFAQDWLPDLYACDLQRSVRDVPVFNSENHLIADQEARHVPPEHLRAALWQEAVHGQSATTLWVWERSSNPHDPVFGSVLERPTCVEAVGRTCLDLNRLALPVTALQRAPAEVSILEATSAKVWDGGTPEACAEQLYTALTFLGHRVGFVTEQQLESGVRPQGKVIFVPNVTHLSDAAFRTLADCSQRLVCVGMAIPRRNEYDLPRVESLHCEMMPWDPAHGSWRDLWQALPAALGTWGVYSGVTLRTMDGAPVWGVSSLATEERNALVVDLCNYRKTPIHCEVRYHGRVVEGTDLLSGRHVNGTVSLAPLQVCLIRSSERLSPRSPLKPRLH